jgi:secondary thiamine-phosphate synthase enzyme
MVFQKELTLRTYSCSEMHDLIDAVTRIVSESGVRTGIVQIFNVGSTAAIGAIEFEPGLKQDLPALLRRLIPPSRDYAHEQTWHDGNGHSHLQEVVTVLGE